MIENKGDSRRSSFSKRRLSDFLSFRKKVKSQPYTPEIMTKNHGPSIKNDEKYEALREEGMSKTKAARIANTPDSGKKGGKAKDYEDRSKQELYDKAKEIGIDGRSKMSKSELITALRNS